MDCGVLVEITVEADNVQSEPELRSLRTWLVEEEDLRGRVTLRSGAPVPGTLGPVADILAVSLAPGGVAAVFAGALVSYIRHRTGDATYKLTRADGSQLEVSARRVRGLDAPGVQAMVTELTLSLEAQDHPCTTSTEAP